MRISALVISASILTGCSSDKSAQSITSTNQQQDSIPASQSSIPPPTISPSSGTFEPQSLRFGLQTSIVGAEIHFTTDGSIPTKFSTKYSSFVPLIMGELSTYKIRAKVYWGTDSSIESTVTYSPIQVPWRTDIPYGVLVDARDGHVYKTIAIGKQTWMAENLDYHIANLNAVNEITSGCYNDSNQYCQQYGMLYTWGAAVNTSNPYSFSDSGRQVQGICPSGWHLPADSEWNILTNYVINIIQPATLNCTTCSQYELTVSLRALDGWNLLDNAMENKGTDQFVLRILPAIDDGQSAKFWTSTRDSSAMQPEYQIPFWTKTNINIAPYYSRFSIRCVKN